MEQSALNATAKIRSDKSDMRSENTVTNWRTGSRSPVFFRKDFPSSINKELSWRMDRTLSSPSWRRPRERSFSFSSHQTASHSMRHGDYESFKDSIAPRRKSIGSSQSFNDNDAQMKMSRPEISESAAQAQKVEGISAAQSKSTDEERNPIIFEKDTSTTRINQELIWRSHKKGSPSQNETRLSSWRSPRERSFSLSSRQTASPLSRDGYPSFKYSSELRRRSLGSSLSPNVARTAISFSKPTSEETAKCSPIRHENIETVMDSKSADKDGDRPPKIQRTELSVSVKAAHPERPYSAEPFTPVAAIAETPSIWPCSAVKMQQKDLLATSKMEPSECRIIPRYCPPQLEVKHVSSSQKWGLFPRQKHKSLSQSHGVQKRYRTTAHMSALCKKNEEDFSSVLSKSISKRSELPHLKLARIGDRTKALQTVLTYFALGAHYNAPKASDVPRPPAHWMKRTYTM